MGHVEDATMMYVLRMQWILFLDVNRKSLFKLNYRFKYVTSKFSIRKVYWLVFLLYFIVVVIKNVGCLDVSKSEITFNKCSAVNVFVRDV